jgi:hypothetical protein
MSLPLSTYISVQFTVIHGAHYEHHTIQGHYVRAPQFFAMNRTKLASNVGDISEGLMLPQASKK